ncbi:MAG: DUF2807 domain-containing protein [Asgard group archaeon]|nr:DUF2807 domain-containing protein [Asgard group archaeon]
MTTKDIITEKREIQNFSNIIVKEHQEAEIIITQGRREALTIEAPKDIIARIESYVKAGTLIIKTKGTLLQKMQDALTSGISRKQIKYIIQVRKLSNMELTGLIHANISNLKAKNLSVKFNGAGKVQFENLNSKFLSVTLLNIGEMILSGKAKEQIVTINGSGVYDASELVSQITKVDVKGIGKGIIWTKKHLDVSIKGIGKVSYFGSPEVKSTIAPVATLEHLEK